MKKVFLAMVCMASFVMMTACGGGGAKKESSEGTAEVKKEAKASKSVKGEWEAIDPNDEAFRNKPYLDKAKEIGGFEIGKPKSSIINEAIQFSGEGELKDTAISYLIRFGCGEEQIKSSYFDAYAQAIWDACKKVADGGRIFTLIAKKEQDFSSLSDAEKKINSVEGDELDHSFKWNYILNGVTMNVEIRAQSSRNSSNERVQNVIMLNVGAKK